LKKISILIPCYNEEDNVVPLYDEIIKIFTNDLSKYDYEIIFIDNHSTDNTQPLLRRICSENIKVKAIFNARNFGTVNSQVYGLCQISGDCVVLLFADFQEPVDMIPVFVKEWEKGYQVVVGIKHKTKENKIKRFLRTCYYKVFRGLSFEVEQIEHFDGFGLYDNSFIKTLKSIHEPSPYIKNLVAELAVSRKDILYTQQKRRTGKSKINWYIWYNDAMLGFTSYTKIGLRIATIVGFVSSTISFFIAGFYLLYKLLNWHTYYAGFTPIIVGVYFLGSLQLFFIGFIGEYVMAINTRVMNRPLVIEKERINF
jgi:glycosyltransferase involved in cell wall biosynthesis